MGQGQHTPRSISDPVYRIRYCGWKILIVVDLLP